jgi:hypothetical protein
MLDIIDAADIGLSGIVTDAYTDEPINATIWVEEVYWPCFTDPIFGDYHKLLPDGSYTVNFQANGYKEETYEVEITDSFSSVELNVSLTPDNNFYAHQVTWCEYYDPYSYPNNFQNNPSEGVSALGYPDDICASLGKGGSIVLDMGVEGEIIDLEDESDFIIYEGDNDDSYEVYVSSYWDGPWSFMGIAEGTTQFDLNDASIDSAQFVKIVDDNDGDPYENNPGVDIDSIKCLKTPIVPSDPPTVPEINGPNLGVVDIEYNFTFLSTDPEDKQLYYLIDWGDGTNSGWIGPYLSGEIISESHKWENIGDYYIKAKARDGDNAESTWSLPHFIKIDNPTLSIEQISSGLFRIRAIIKNSAEVEAENVQWNINFEGGALIGSQTNGVDDIPANGEIDIHSKFIIGFGPTQVKVEAICPKGISDSRQQGGFIYLFYIKINPGG